MILRFCHTMTAMIIAIVFALMLGSARAEDDTSSTVEESTDQLEIVQSIIDSNIESRSDLRDAIKNGAPDEVPELEQELEALNSEQKKLAVTFERMAIGAIDITVLEDTETSFDWRREFSEIMQPIVANLKVLTDKPRKVSQLQVLIGRYNSQTTVIDEALASIERYLDAVEENSTTKASLEKLQKSWLSRQSENQQSLELALSQLNDLENPNTNWYDNIGSSLAHFFRGRGLTLLFACIAAFVVWSLMRAILSLTQRKKKTGDKKGYKTRTRVAQYAYRVLTFVLTIIVVISVFYVRGDLLLMGLSILAAAGIALGLRQAIPRFITETKLLLNLGPIREKERVMYAGLPWLIESINMYSVLRNPELYGIVRLPLGQMNSLVSRPVGKEPWFPASRGDFILLEGRRLFEVTLLTPETVELNDRGGTITAVPTADFYSWTFKNLSRGDFFGVSSSFGIDYKHQDICLTVVPPRFRQALIDALKSSDLAKATKEVLVEFKSAGASSLDFWIYITLDQKAAKSYNMIDRLIQKTLVAVCSEEQWGIPFPHITVQNWSAPTEPLLPVVPS